MQTLWSKTIGPDEEEDEFAEIDSDGNERIHIPPNP